MALPIYQDPNKNLMLLQTNWSSSLNPVIINQLVTGQFLQNISLNAGSNVVNTKLSKTQSGWFIVDNSTPSIDIYRSAPFNSSTLTLTASAPCTISLWVF